jgi:diaminohydroxyphosphoribosylaminopyrimidine deaminase/5-amino-6-(5-phosphoribosylamino)uracil reductase
VKAEHDPAMLAAVAEAEKARGSTGDNPWVGCVITMGGEILARGYTQGPGEDHAEIVAIAEARERGVELASAVLYSTLEPCSFHGRTPACAHAIVRSGVKRVVVGIPDPNPRVDGAGVKILRDAGLEVIEACCAREITRQLAPWIFRYHPHEPERTAKVMLARHGAAAAQAIAEHYGIDLERAAALLARVPR